MKGLTRIIRMSDLRMQHRSVARELRKESGGSHRSYNPSRDKSTDDNKFKRALQVKASRAIPLCRGP